jgi:hypothetical protein
MYIYAVPGQHPTFNILTGYMGTGINMCADAINKIFPKFRISFEVYFSHSHFMLKNAASLPL